MIFHNSNNYKHHSSNWHPKDIFYNRYLKLWFEKRDFICKYLNENILLNHLHCRHLVFFFSSVCLRIELFLFSFCTLCIHNSFGHKKIVSINIGTLVFLQQWFKPINHLKRYLQVKLKWIYSVSQIYFFNYSVIFMWLLMY
jgi:hypothetical protein